MIASRSQTHNGNSGCHDAGDLGSGGGAMTYVWLTDLDLEDGITDNPPASAFAAVGRSVIVAVVR